LPSDIPEFVVTLREVEPIRVEVEAVDVAQNTFKFRDLVVPDVVPHLVDREVCPLAPLVADVIPKTPSDAHVCESDIDHVETSTRLTAATWRTAPPIQDIDATRSGRHSQVLLLRCELEGSANKA
jgi:hypothetical protein